MTRLLRRWRDSYYVGSICFDGSPAGQATVAAYLLTVELGVRAAGGLRRVR